MRIIEFQAENIKKLKVVTIKPKGHVVSLTGPNGSGKSSVLDAILYALAGTDDVPSKPIRSGADKGGVLVDLGDFIAVRKFTASGNVLILEDKKGARYPSPQKMLDKLFGDLSFDPLAFTRLKPKEQAEALQKLSRLKVDPGAIDAANAEDYKTRTGINNEVKQLRARADAISFVAELPAEPIDISRLIARMEEAGTKNAEIVSIESSIMRRKDANAETMADAGRMRIRIKALQQEIKDLEAAAAAKEADAKKEDKAIAAIKIPDAIDTSALREEIENARATNTQIEKRNQKMELLSQIEAREADAKSLTETMKGRIAQKEKAIAEADMPIPGLGFSEGEVTYNGLPLNQASGAEQLRVSMAIAMAGNPEARIILVRDGSLLDPKSMEIVTKMAIERDYQIWIERVDVSGKVGIVMEDGEVAAVNDEEDPAPAPSKAELDAKVARTSGGRKRARA